MQSGKAASWYLEKKLLAVNVLDPSVVVPFPVIRGNTVITNIKGKKFQCLAFFAETKSLNCLDRPFALRGHVTSFL